MIKENVSMKNTYKEYYTPYRLFGHTCSIDYRKKLKLIKVA